MQESGYYITDHKFFKAKNGQEDDEESVNLHNNICIQQDAVYPDTLHCNFIGRTALRSIFQHCAYTHPGGLCKKR